MLSIERPRAHQSSITFFFDTPRKLRITPQASSRANCAIFGCFILDGAMDMIISAILSRRPEKKQIRPGSPWHRAQSPLESSLVSDVLESKARKCC